MIQYSLQCSKGHRYDAWFKNADAYDQQQARGIVSCAVCGDGAVEKAPMAPAVPRKGNQRAVAQPVAGGQPTPEALALFEKIARLQAEAIKSSTWVGEAFAEQSRRMHYGEQDAAPIHGRATADEARELADEGIPVAPLLIPVAPPDELN